MKRKLNEHDVPEPVQSTFAAFGLDERLTQCIVEERFEQPTAVQSRTIPLIQAGKSVAVRAKTGTGKTMAYLLPVVDSILRSGSLPSIQALILTPSKELSSQISSILQRFSQKCGKSLTYVNLSRAEDDTVTRSRLQEKPSIIVATPGRYSQFLDAGLTTTASIKHLVIDEADLILSYGYDDDLRNIASSLSSSVQTVFISATLRTDGDELEGIFSKSGPVEMVDMSAQELEEQSKLEQYVVATAEDEKFLLLYAIFKLKLIRGKIIIFVADVDRCYRLKLFLEQFGVRSCVLNSELPVNSRLHVVEEFNKGVYDTLIAADDNEVVGEGHKPGKRNEADESGDERIEQQSGTEGEMNKGTSTTQPAKKKIKKRDQDAEFGVSRGIDFRRVTCVLNFDLPQSSRSYTHRTGRTARAGEKGMALSFYVPSDLYRKHKPTSIPQCANDEKILARIKRKQEEDGKELEQWQFDMEKLVGFKYRLADALRAVTRIAVREARTRELRQELINSAKLERHFEEHPEDLRHLRHDTESHAVRQQAHLKHVPDYLLPAGGQGALKKEVGFVGLNSRSTNSIRKARAVNKSRGKGRIARSKGFDPLKSLNARGRGKK